MEAAGLALGSVALAGLFSSCIDVLEYLETGRHWARDVHITLTKLGLIKQRLRQWGTALAITSVASGQQLLPKANEQEEWLISDSLCGIHDLLHATSRLCLKHGCERDSSPHWPVQVGHNGVYCDDSQISGVSIDSLDDVGKPGKRSPENNGAGSVSLGWKTLRLRVVWAVVDKGRFNSLIAELDFLVSNLERLSERTSMPSSRASSSEPEEYERKTETILKTRPVTANKPQMASMSNLPPIVQRAIQKDKENGSRALVPFRSKGAGDRPAESKTAYVHRGTEHKTSQKSEANQQNPKVYRNTATDDSRQVNKSGPGGPTVSHNSVSDRARQVNGDVDNAVAMKCFD